MLVSYTQGRFSTDPKDTRKYYALTKGSVDPEDNGDTLAAAVRETYEESGIDVRKLLGEENFAKFKAGHVIENVASPGYPGVTVTRADRNQHVRYDYKSVAGKDRDAQLFTLELDGIHHLTPYLKRLPHRNQAAVVSHVDAAGIGDARESRPDKAELHDGSIAEYVAARSYPTFAELLEILRSGKITQKRGCAWAKEDKILIENPNLTQYEKNHNIDPITKPDAFARFYRDTLTGVEFKQLKSEIGAIKAYFNDQKLTCDQCAVKLDDNDFPLSFYFEGGEILPVEVAITRSAQAALSNRTYADAMWGTKGLKENEAVEKRVKHCFDDAQIAGVAKALAFGSAKSTKAARVGLESAAARVLEKLEKGASPVATVLCGEAGAFAGRMKKPKETQESPQR